MKRTPRAIHRTGIALAILIAAVCNIPDVSAQTTGWSQIPNTILRNVCPPNNFGGSSYSFTSLCNGVIDAWNGGVLDTSRNRFIIWGGGHTDYSGNEMYSLDLNTLALSRLTDPGLPVATACPDSLVNGTQPNSRHTYGGIAYMANVDKMFVFGGSLATCGGASQGTWAFNFAANHWETLSPSGTVPRGDLGVVSAYDPNTGKVFLHDSLDLYTYSPVSNSYQKLTANGTGIDYHLSAVIDPVRKKFVILGGSQAWIYDISGSTFTKQTLSTTGGTAITGSDYPGLAYDPTLDRIVAWAGGNNVYQLNLDTNTWSSTSFSGGPARGVTGVFGHWQYSPASGAYVTINSADSNAYMLRLSSSPPPPPPPPPTVSITAPASGTTVSSAVTVSATASSGVVGVQFKLDSANLGAEDTVSPYSMSWNTTTASNGSHTLTAVARDSTGNTATSSPVTVTVSNTPPPPLTVSITSPANGSSDTGTVTVTATASSNAVGVQFQLDAANLGAEDTVSPYAMSWNTTTASNGSHTLTAIARNSSGNRTTSSPISVTVNNAAPPPPTGVTSFQLTSGVSGTLPFTVGLGFKKGDVPGFPVLDVSTSQVIVKSRWSDNSVKHAIASGRIALTAGVPATVNVSSSATAPGGTNLTATDIQTANPSASVQLGSIGTVNLSNLLATPFRTWISGPEMVEAHYRSSVGSDPTLQVWFYVRLYKNGQMWIRTVAENGYLDVTPANKTYVPNVTIGGATVFNNGGASLTHYGHTRWTAEGWIGGDPQITPKHDTTYLMASKLVPNYWKRNPSSTALNGLYQSYSPMQNGNWTPTMGDTGYQPQIGLLPNWDALYVTSGADARAYQSVLANAKALSSYPIVWDDSVTNLPTAPSNRPTWTIDGPNAGGETQYGAGTLTWDLAHHGSGGYLAYLITGDYFYLETMEDQSSLCYLFNSSGQGSGTSRIMQQQTRGVAWCDRTLGQLAGIGPSDAVVNDYRTLLGNNAAYWNTQAQKPGQNPLGYVYSYEIGSYGTGAVSAWQQHFWAQTYGFVSDLEPFTDMSTWNAVRDHLYESPVGILGPTGTSNYCFTGASAYTIVVSSNNSSDTTTWYQSWGTVYQSTFGTANTSCGNTLTGSSGGDPANGATGYWGNLLPAIAYAVEDGAAGASAAWTRLTGASNWSTVANSGFDDTPIWGIVPRSTTPPPPPPPPSFDFSVSSGGNKTVVPGQSVTNTITATLVSGTTQAVTFSASGLPTGATASFSPGSCNPTCSSTLTLTTSASTPAGSSTITVTGAGGVTHTTSFSLTVTAAADTTPPSTPTGLTATPASSSQINLSWTASTDNVGVTGYKIFRGGTQVGTSSTNSYSDTGLTAGTSYSYAVSAFDAAGNNSAQSSSVTATTPASTGTLQVGPTRQYQTIGAALAAAVNGNTIEIDAGMYNEAVTVTQNNLTLKGIGGYAHLNWGTGNYLTNTTTIPNGKGLMVIDGSGDTVDGLEFSGAKVVDQNGAGIRYEGGDLTIRHSYFHDNENGIMGEGGASNVLLIENSIFQNNGFCATSCAHNVYIGFMGRLIFRFNKSIDSHQGHTLKSRASVNEVISNFLSTKNNDGSYEADFPSGGTVYFIGNVIEQGVNTGNSSILVYGEEGITNSTTVLDVVNNTFYNFLGSGTFLDISGTPSLIVRNNIFAGGGAIGPTADSSNKTLTSSSFVNSSQGDYHLVAGSPAIDGGTNPGSDGTYSLTPQFEYVEPASQTSRVISGVIDSGAYEFQGSAPSFDFSLSNSGNGTVVQGQSVIDTITATLISGTTQAVTLSASGLPAGVTAAFSPGSCSPTCSSTLTLTTSASTPTGSSTITVTGVAGSLSHTTTFTLTVNAPPPSFDFSLSNGGNKTVVQGQSITNTITATLVSGTAQAVTFSASGLPAGATASFSPGSCNPTCSSTLTLTASTSTPAGSSTITVTGTAGSLSRTTSFTLTVNAAPPPFDFSLTNGGNQTVVQGQSVTNTITATLVSGTTQSVTFAASGLPSGATASFSPGSCGPTCSSTVTVTTSASTPTGSSTITVTGTAGSLSHTTTFTLTVTAATPGCVVSSASWKSQSIPTQTGSFTASFDATPSITTDDGVIGLSSATAAAYTDLAAIVRFNTSGFIDARNNTAYTSDTATAYTANTSYHFRLVVNIPSHTYSVYVTPQGGSETQIANNYAFRETQATATSLSDLSSYSNAGTTNICNVQVSSPPPPSFDFSLTNGGNKTVVQGQSVSNTITATLVSGTTQPVTLAASGLPSGATASFSPGSCSPTCSSTVTVTTSASTPAGSSTITVTGTAGSLSHTTAFTLTVNALFDFSLSNGGSKTVVQGQSSSNTITATLVSGTAQSVSFSASGLPAGATAAFSPGSCTPACTSTLTIATSAPTPAGSSTITVTGTAGSLSHTTTFTLTVTASTGGHVIDIFPGTDVFGPAVQSLVAGDTLVVHQGTYNETARTSIQVTGTATAPITIMGATGEATPVITRPAAASIQNTINIEGAATYLTIRGLEIIGNGGDGVKMSGNLSFITLQDLVIHDIAIGINFSTSMSNITVRHNHIYNTGIDGGTGEGMWVGCDSAACIVHDSLIVQNWIHDVLPGTTEGDGIEVKVGSYSNIVRDNVIYNRTYPAITVYATGSNPVNVVEGNVIWNAEEGIFAIADAIVRNNIVFNSGTGLSLYPHAQVAQMKNVTAVNNTLYNNTTGVLLRWSSTNPNMVLANNAIYSPSSTALDTSTSVGVFVANYVTGGSDRLPDGVAFVAGGSAASAFVNAPSSNFWPNTSSPLRGSASAGYAPADDFNHTQRAVPYDVGAYQTNGLASNPGWAIAPGFRQ